MYKRDLFVTSSLSQRTKVTKKSPFVLLTPETNGVNIGRRRRSDIGIFPHDRERQHSKKLNNFRASPFPKKVSSFKKVFRFMECNKVLQKLLFRHRCTQKIFFFAWVVPSGPHCPFFSFFYFFVGKPFCWVIFSSRIRGGNFRKRFCAPAGTLSSHAVCLNNWLQFAERTNEFPWLI